MPLLLNPDLFSEPGAETFFRTLFSPPTHREGESYTLLSRELYEDRVLPFIQGMWSVRAYDVRAMMLVMVEEYVGALVRRHPAVLTGVLIPEVGGHCGWRCY